MMKLEQSVRPGTFTGKTHSAHQRDGPRLSVAFHQTPIDQSIAVEPGMTKPVATCAQEVAFADLLVETLK